MRARTGHERRGWVEAKVFSILLGTDGGGKPLEDCVREFIGEHPGCGMREVRGGVHGRNDDIDAAERKLLSAVENRGSETAFKLYVREPVTVPE